MSWLKAYAPENMSLISCKKSLGAFYKFRTFFSL